MAVVERLPANPQMPTNGRQGYVFARVPTRNGRTSVAVARAIHQGQGHAQTVARDMIDDLQPSWLLLVGIAGGTPDHEYTLGDVHVCSFLHDFSVAAALQDRAPTFQVMGGRMHPAVERLLGPLPALLEGQLSDWKSAASIRSSRPTEAVPRSIKSKKLYGSAAWQRKVLASLAAHFPEPESGRAPRVAIAPTISSNALIKDADLMARWQESARAASHVEMELGGVYRAARTRDARGNDVEIPILAIRGVSDIVGYERNPAWTEYACHSAAALAFALIRAGVFATDGNRSQGGTQERRPRPAPRGRMPLDQTMANPFDRVVAIRDPVRLIGRDSKLQRLQRLLHAGSVALVGAPKVGKSSLLHALARRWQERAPSRLIGPVDLQGVEDAAHFYHELANALGQDKSDWRSIQKRLRREPALLLLDEIDSGPNRCLDAEQLMRLRSVCNANPGCKVVCVSRRPLRDVFPDQERGSPAFNIFSPLLLDGLSQDAARTLLEHPWMPDAPALAPAHIDEILAMAGEHPFLLQRAAYHCFEAMLDPEHDWRVAWQRDREHML